MVTLGLSVGRVAIEPQSERVNAIEPRESQIAEADVLVYTAGNNILS